MLRIKLVLLERTVGTAMTPGSWNDGDKNSGYGWLERTILFWNSLIPAVPYVHILLLM